MVQRNASPLSDALMGVRQRLASSVVLANVVFGQSSLGCRGNGLCRVDLVTSQHSSSNHYEASQESVCQRVMVSFCYDHTGLKMIIPKKQLSSQTIEQHFSKPFFKVAETFYFSAEMMEKLGLLDVMIPVGQYEMTEEKYFLVVYLKK